MLQRLPFYLFRIPVIWGPPRYTKGYPLPCAFLSYHWLHNILFLHRHPEYHTILCLYNFSHRYLPQKSFRPVPTECIHGITDWNCEPYTSFLSHKGTEHVSEAFHYAKMPAGDAPQQPPLPVSVHRDLPDPPSENPYHSSDIPPH